MIGKGEIYEKCGNKKEAMPLGGIDCPNKKNFNLFIFEKNSFDKNL